MNGRTVTFRNGTIKEISTDGQITVRYVNGDVKEETADGTVTYFYNNTRTVCMYVCVYIYMHAWIFFVYISILGKSAQAVTSNAFFYT
jgi:hypothetical protein